MTKVAITGPGFPTASTPTRRVPPPGPDQAAELLLRLGTLAPDDPARLAVRAAVITLHLPLAAHLARRFGGRGENLADLTQIATLGLIKAVDRYDASRGVPFISYAVPTIAGELKRHFRDSVWNVRPPRALQELVLQLGPATEDLAQSLHRLPTTAELAVRLRVSSDQVIDARRGAKAYRPVSIDGPTLGDDRLPMIASLGRLDPGIDAADDRETLRVGLATLPARERRIIALRYFADQTQAQIAVDIGVSQMQISRLLAQSMDRLRAGVAIDPDRAVAA